VNIRIGVFLILWMNSDLQTGTNDLSRNVNYYGGGN
jgi:hypothetical protein